jgi:DNA-binding CsgD family transcriptional regulator
MDKFVGWTRLTTHERQVAELVAQGMTNREVGERMIISRHTVDFHLRQVFRKLDVHSRVEVATLLARGELPSDGD